MKLKSLPEDFLVTEITDFRESHGPFAYYRLSKRSIGTPEAIQIIIRNWNLSRNQVSYGGLKDRHADTLQYVTIFQGPKQSHEERSFLLEYLGQADRAFGPADIRANEFEITLRGFAPDKRPLLEQQLSRLSSNGIVNYFDDQRFGSLGISGDFIGRAWCKGDYERAVFLAIAEPNTHDRPREKEQKEILRKHWGNWLRCKDLLDRSHRRSIVTYLCDHPTDFKRAVGLIRIDMRSLYVAAFQSYLWNRWLSEILIGMFPAERIEWIEGRCGKLATPVQLEPDAIDSLRQLELPLPSARQKEWPTDWKPALEEILAKLEMTIPEIRLKYPRDTFFSKGTRACWIGVPGMTYSFLEDDLHPGKVSINLKFSLPKGCYATMIVKQLTQVVEEEPIRENEEVE